MVPAQVNIAVQVVWPAGEGGGGMHENWSGWTGPGRAGKGLGVCMRGVEISTWHRAVA